MANYEMMLIINPNLSEDDNKKTIGELKELFQENSVKIVKEDIWGNKRLAYSINKQTEGFYVLFDLEMDGKLIKTLSKTINLNQNIFRYMFVKKEK